MAKVQTALIMLVFATKDACAESPVLKRATSGMDAPSGSVKNPAGATIPIRKQSWGKAVSKSASGGNLVENVGATVGPDSSPTPVDDSGNPVDASGDDSDGPGPGSDGPDSAVPEGNNARSEGAAPIRKRRKQRTSEDSAQVETSGRATVPIRKQNWGTAASNEMSGYAASLVENDGAKGGVARSDAVSPMRKHAWEKGTTDGSTVRSDGTASPIRKRTQGETGATGAIEPSSGSANPKEKPTWGKIAADGDVTLPEGAASPMRKHTWGKDATNAGIAASDAAGPMRKQTWGKISSNGGIDFPDGHSETLPIIQ